MTVQEQPYPVIRLVIDTFGEWLKHRRELREMREMDAANFGNSRRRAYRLTDWPSPSMVGALPQYSS